MPRTETEDREFSREFAADLQPILTMVLDKGTPMELRDNQIVIRADVDRVIYLEVRAMTLSGPMRVRRPAKRGQSKLRLVRS